MFFAHAQERDLDILDTTNALRTSPASYINKLQAMLPRFSGNLYDGPYGRVLTKEGRSAVEEAIAYLSTKTAVTELTWNRYLEYACEDHVLAQGPAGQIGHISPDGATTQDRLGKYGTACEASAENLYYGTTTAGEDIVLSMLIGDGDSTRKQRENLFSPDSKVMGAHTGPHRDLTLETCINFAGKFEL
jgi:uncharacterized protein YkwD